MSHSLLCGQTGANDLQTLADRLVQQSICAPLSKSFPKITIIGEEDLPEEAVKEDLIESSQSEEILQVLSIGIQCPERGGTSELKLKPTVLIWIIFWVLTSHSSCVSLVVWVDPLDGTKEYTEVGQVSLPATSGPDVSYGVGRPASQHDSPYGDTVLIGISYGGKAIAGVINQPFFNYQLGTETADMWGMPGLGAFGFELQEVPDGRRIVTMTRSQSNKLVTDTVDAMIVKLVEGKASACVFASLGTKKWGTCAPEAILHALGGKQHPLDHTESTSNE
ncbi:unnamed protein product [Oncorhynchus mykiss]|uniref:Uncharacterized protein n=1 Tax=Oncorhynchus mykiss TaxID=8022 RepID=A0A060XA25_ONCMY|nr:unnamed protein product [Oncorhynchus mykiss]